jgi:hypothetical protein
MPSAIHKMGGDNVVTNTEAILFSDGTEQFTAYIEPVGSTTLYVDNDREDVTYTPDGTYFRPYSTISDAVARIVSNGDNTASKAYVIQISGGTYPETVDLSNSALVNLVFVGNNAVTIGVDGMTEPVVQAVNNDSLVRCLFYGIVFYMHDSAAHGIEFSSVSSGTQLGLHGIVFTECGMQGSVADCYFNNVSFILFDDTGVTANINAINVDLIQFANGNGPNPQTPFTITTDTGTAAPANWPGYSRAAFVGCGVGSVTTDSLSQVQITNCIVSGTITAASSNVLIVSGSIVFGSIVVNVDGVLGLVNCLVAEAPNAVIVPTVSISGVLFSSLSNITGIPITVEDGGIFVENAAVHDTANLTVVSGGAYSSAGDMGVGNLYVTQHINSTTGNPDMAGQIQITSGTSASFTFENPYTDAPVVTITPNSDPTAVGAYWATSTAEGFEVFIKVSGTINFNYQIIGNPN